MSKWVLGLFLILSLIGCQRKQSGESARLQLTLPASLGTMKVQAVNRSGAGATWNSSLNPSQLSDINCYAVLVSGPEADMQKGSCQMNDLSKMPVGLALGLFAASTSLQTSADSQTISIEVPSGDQRVISIVGFVAAVGGCSLGMDRMKQDLLSVPHLIGQLTSDLEPGESEKNKLNLTVALSVTADKQISDCAGIIQPDASVTTTTTTTTTTSSTSSTSTTTSSTSTTTSSTSTSTTTTTTMPPNNAPVATTDVMTVEYTNGGVAVNPLGNDTDADANALTITGATNGSFGSVGFTGSTVTYTPNGVHIGSDSFTYTIDDGNGATAVGTIQVRVMSPHTWTGDGGNSLWTTAANWCGSVATPGLSGVCSGGTVPSGSDNVVFNSFCSACNVTLNAGVSIAKLILDSSYTGTFTQGSGYALTVGSGGMKILGGTFVGGTGSITSTGNVYIQTTGAFTAPSGTMILNNSTVVTIDPVGSFNPNGGTFLFGQNGPVSLTVGAGVSFNNLSFTSSASQVINLNAGNINVLGSLTLSSSTTRAIINNGNILVNGNVTLSNQGAKGTAVVKISGVSAQTITGASNLSWVPNLEINKSGGILSYVGIIPVVGNYRWLLGDTNMAGLTELILTSETGGSFDFLPGNLNNYTNVTFDGYGANYNMGGQVLELTGALTLMDQSTRGTLDNGTVRVRGDLDLIAYGKSGTALIEIFGNSNQNITGQATAGCPNIAINSMGGTVSLIGDLLFLNHFSLNAGSVNAGSATVEFGGTGTATVILAGLSFYNVKFSGNGKTIELGGQTMIVNGSLTLSDNSIGFLNNGWIYSYGNVTSTTNGKAGTANVKMMGSSAATLTQVSPSSKFPGTLIIYKGGGVATLTSNLNLATSGQDLTIGMGTLDQAGFNTTINDTLTIDAGATLTLSGGTKSHGVFVNNGTLN